MHYRNWNESNGCVVLCTGSTIYAITVRPSSKGKFVEAKGAWEECINSYNSELLDIDYRVEMIMYSSIDGKKLIPMHSQVKKMDIENHIQDMIKEIDPLGNILLMDYDLYIIRTCGDVVILYLSIVGENKKLPHYGVMKWFLIFSIAINTGCITHLRWSIDPVETNISQNSCSKDLERIRTYLAKANDISIQNYKFYSNANILRGISLSLIMHPVLPLGICK